MKGSLPHTVYTIGHSTRDIDEFVAMLWSFGIVNMVDIRSMPGSRKYPQFNGENPEAVLRATAYMCAEAVWWRCHRSMVSDHLKAGGWRVLHIMAVGKVQDHAYTSPAKVVGNRISYKD